MWRCLATALLALVASACASPTPPRAEANAPPLKREVPSSICKRARPPSQCFDLRDAEARRIFRELRGRRRVWMCSAGLGGGHTTVAYSPSVVAPNRVATAELGCTMENGRVLCALAMGEAHFAEDPTAYFHVSEGVDPADAVAIVGAFYAGRVVGDAAPRGDRIVSVSAVADGSFSLGIADCGCWVSQHFRREMRGPDTWLVPGLRPLPICE